MEEILSSVGHEVSKASVAPAPTRGELCLLALQLSLDRMSPRELQERLIGIVVRSTTPDGGQGCCPAGKLWFVSDILLSKQAYGSFMSLNV